MCMENACCDSGPAGARESNPAREQTIRYRESRSSPDIGCIPRRIGRRGHLALLPAAPSWIHIADRLALRSQRLARDSDHGKERDVLEKLI